MYKELLEYIVKNLVKNPDKVSIQVEEKEGKTVLNLNVDSEDIGRVIGKEGRLIRAIREVINAYAMKESKKVMVSVDESK